jgi:hypothetical protein
VLGNEGFQGGRAQRFLSFATMSCPGHRVVTHGWAASAEHRDSREAAERGLVHPADRSTPSTDSRRAAVSKSGSCDATRISLRCSSRGGINVSNGRGG